MRMAHGECLSRLPCKDCDLRFFSTIRQRTLFLILSLPFKGELGGVCKQRSNQTPLPCLYPHSGKRSLLEEVFDSVYKTAFYFAHLRSRLRFRLLYFLFCRFRRLFFWLTYIIYLALWGNASLPIATFPSSFSMVTEVSREQA